MYRQHTEPLPSRIRMCRYTELYRDRMLTEIHVQRVTLTGTSPHVGDETGGELLASDLMFYFLQNKYCISTKFV